MQMSLYEVDQGCGSVRTPKFNILETHFMVKQWSFC